MKVHGLVQARMGSSRLPGKVMRPLAGRPLVWHLVDRLRRVPQLAGVVLATTTAPADDELALFAEAESIALVRWPEADDIAGRLAAAADLTGADAFLKINADCPLIDPGILSTMVQTLIDNPDAAVVCNKLVRTFPLGVSAELISTDAIRWCDAHLDLAEDRELTIKWILDRPERFPAISVESPADNGDLELTVDDPADYEVIAGIFDALYRDGEAFTYADLLRHLGRSPLQAPLITRRVESR